MAAASTAQRHPGQPSAAESHLLGRELLGRQNGESAEWGLIPGLTPLGLDLVFSDV